MTANCPIVIATFSRRLRLRLPGGERADARIKGKRLKPVVGDRVEAEPIEREDDWLITAILDRRNSLTRPDLRGRTEVLAANIDLLIAVAAVAPRPDWFVVDRYLCAAENMDAQAAVVLNKIDLDRPSSGDDAVLAAYDAAGYPTIRCSARTGTNVDRLETLIDANTAIIVGQSGVGKSSLINRLVRSAELPTGSISSARGEGRHTTVNSVMLELPRGGAVIDSPGVRDYAPSLDDAGQVARGFREIYALRSGCRFANCRHTREPDCAVKRAVQEGDISSRRHESYRRLLSLTERLAEKR
jgi:ribosome biogenesis GTPase